MRNSLLLGIFLFIVSSCNNSPDSTEKIKKQVIRIAEDHLKEQFRKPEKTVSKDGIVVYSENNIKTLIDPKYILIGEIDADSKPDAIVTIFTFRDQALALREHLMLVNKDGKLIIAKVLEGDMKFLSIKDKIIYIETSKMSSDSPLYGCKLCTEVNKYQFIGGDTVRMK
jgi:hypothetical protein